jgi:hypothetical protein
MAQLAESAQRPQQDPVTAVEGIRRGYADYKAGVTHASEEVFEELRVKHGLPR